MPSTLLTPEQAHAVGAALQRLVAWWQRLREQFAALAERVTETTRHLVRFAARTRARVRTDRPAWASPYGPAPIGFR
ncbi:hypothetical protein ACFXKY_15705 [Streptomyces canus]|uniref:hypothetical protein n=1 Tax=Streptomyces canus TaxID=58343 RepID=UPI0036885C47